MARLLLATAGSLSPRENPAGVPNAKDFATNPETGDLGCAGTTSPGNAPAAISAGAFDLQGTVTRADDRATACRSGGPTWYDGHATPAVVAASIQASRV